MNKQSNTEIESDPRWQAVLDRRATDGSQWVYAVLTTGIFCRPTCPSRRPKPQNVRLYETVGDAQAAGFRPCKRCCPTDIASPAETRAEAARRIIEEAIDPPNLSSLALAVGCSPHHLLRTFRATFGVTPAVYGRALKHRRFREGLRAGNGVTAALYDAGFSSPSQVYGANAELGMAPGRYAKGGQGMHIAFGLFDCPLDRLLVAATPNGVCAIYFGNNDQELSEELIKEFPRASIVRDELCVTEAARHIKTSFEYDISPDLLPLDVNATAFQARVWNALRLIPRGSVRTYKCIAEELAIPGAYRAVGRACATNPVSLIIPCHRAVRSDGGLAGYRWGLDRKRKLLDRERKQSSNVRSE